MYIIVSPSCAHEGSQIDFFDTYEAVERFILEYHSDLKRIRIYESTPLVLSFHLEKDDG